jgi:hypothetical protein
MSTRIKNIPPCSPQPAAPLAFVDLCVELQHAGMSCLEKVALLKCEVVPTPGRIVYLHTATLETRLSGLAPVIFSAVDATTHLQIAQAYFAMTSAAALSFAEFAARSFPFPIVEFRSRKVTPFHNPENDRPHRDFRALIGERGYLHSFVETRSSDALFSITSKMVFGASTAGSALPASTHELQRDLTRFVFYHNNLRSISWLKGKTPVQKLRTFTGFRGMRSFSPWDECEDGYVPSGLRSSKAGNLPNAPDNDSHTGHIEQFINGEEHETDSCHRR